MMFKQTAETVMTIDNLNNSLNRYTVVNSTIRRLEKEIVEIERLISQQEQYSIDLKRFILVKRLNASKSKEEFAYYQKLIQEMYRTHKNTVNAFEEESTIEFLQSHLRDVESISAETRQQHHKLMQHKLALENDFNALKDNLLISDPQAALQKLADAVSLAFKKFEQEYPANQADYLRQFLLFIQHKISILVKGAIAKTRTPDDIRQDYFRLYGLVTMIEERVQLEILYGNDESMPTIVDRQFHAVVEVLMTGTSISLNRDIFIDCWECKTKYVEFIQENPVLFKKLSAVELTREEMNRYTNAVHEYNRTLLTLKDQVAQETFEQVQKVLVEIENSLESLAAKERGLMYKYFTTLLTVTNSAVVSNLIKNDSTEIKQLQLDNFENLIMCEVAGQPDFVKQIKGAALILLGSLLVGASVVAKVATLGFSTPISASGFFAGSAIILQGRGMFNEGNEKGLYKRISDVAAMIRDQEVEKEDDFEPGSTRQNLLAYYQP